MTKSGKVQVPSSKFQVENKVKTLGVAYGKGSGTSPVELCNLLTLHQ